MQKMTLGQIVDFCIEYINRKIEVEKMINEKNGKDKNEKPKVKKRKATQADWDNFWG